MSEGLWPVVAGSDGEDGFVSAPGVDCVGCVACAICRGSRVLSTVSASAEIASPAAISADASSISRRYSRWRSSAGIVQPHEIVREVNGRRGAWFRREPEPVPSRLEFQHPGVAVLGAEGQQCAL